MDTPPLETSTRRLRPTTRRLRLAVLTAALVAAPAGISCGNDEPARVPGEADPTVPEGHQEQPEDADIEPRQGEGPNETDGHSGDTGIDNSVPTDDGSGGGSGSGSTDGAGGTSDGSDDG